MPTTPEVRIGRTTTPSGLDRYEVLGEFPGGGMGVVYRVRDTSLGRVVALKMIRSGESARPEEIVRFNREAEAVSQLDHPNVIRLYDFGLAGGLPYFTMPLAEGGSLAARLKQLTADPRAAVVLLEKVARGVGHAHGRGVLHRDLKPANVLLDAAGEPLVSDFGLAKFVDREMGLTRSGDVLGTPWYMAPEQAGGRNDLVGPWTDVWALGAVLYEVLTGRLPFPGQNREQVLHRILTTAPRPLRILRPELCPALEGIVLRCLRQDPSQRQATAGALADDLADWLTRERPAGEGRRKFLAAAACMAGALALPAALLFSARRNERPSDPRDATRPESRERIQERVVTLVGRNGPAVEPRWIVGKENSPSTEQVPKEGILVRARELVLLELVHEAPWHSYRLEADVRYEQGQRGEVGLYFAHCSYEGGTGTQHCFCRLGFADRNGGLVDFRVCRWDGTFLAWSGLGLSQTITATGGTGTSRRSRTLALTVSPREVSLFWEGQALDSVPVTEINHQPWLVGGISPVPWEKIRSGALGIYLYRAAALFARVVLKHEPT